MANCMSGFSAFPFPIVIFTVKEMDCHPRHSIQLAGEDGSSKHEEERFDTGLGGEWFFDQTPMQLRPAKRLTTPFSR